MGESLRQHLINAKLAGWKHVDDEGGYTFRSNEWAADLAMQIFVGWVDRYAKVWSDRADSPDVSPGTAVAMLAKCHGYVQLAADMRRELSGG